jgi:hypothetical protein
VESPFALLVGAPSNPLHSVRLIFYTRLSAASKTSMNNAVLRLSQCTAAVHTIELVGDEEDEGFFPNFIEARLEMNRNSFFGR